MAGLYLFYEYVYKDLLISRKLQPISNSSNIHICETTVCTLRHAVRDLDELDDCYRFQSLKPKHEALR